MTLQDVFNKVRDHLLKQNRRATWNQQCMYRTVDKDGCCLKCAIGCLISDEHYDPMLEACSPRTASVISAILLSNPGMKEMEFPFQLFKDLQAVHDDCIPSFWAIELCVVASKHGLMY